MNPIHSIMPGPASSRCGGEGEASGPARPTRPQPDSLAGARRHFFEHVSAFLLFCVLTFLLLTANAFAEGANDRELWVPTEHLDAVLKKMPRAVLLEPEQYNRLRAEFKQANLDRSKAEIKPPVPATIRSATIVGTVESGASVVALTATYEVESFTDGWTEVPLLLPAGHLGHVSIDEQSAIRSGPKKPTILLTHGRGIHTVSAIYHLPIERSPGGNAISLIAPGVPAKVTLAFPEDAEVKSALPFYREPENDRAVFALPSQSGSTHEIRWSAQKVAPIPGAAVLQTCSYVYNLEATNIRADLGFVISSNLTDLPRRFTIRYPEDFRVLSVDGSELLRWNRGKSGELEIVLLPGDREAADLRILLERDLIASNDTDGGDITAELPVVTIPGVHRASGSFSLIGSADVRVKTIETGSLAAPIPDNAEGALANVPHYVASFSFPVSSDPPRVTLSPVQNRFNAQIDTLVTLQREQIAIERTLQILPREGTVFHVDLTLPGDEEFTEAVSERDDFSWKRLDDNTLRLLWEKGVIAGGTAGVTLSTRRDPEGWYSLGQDPATLTFASTEIAGADAVSGYLAVAFDSSFQVKTIDSEGLEIRDARTTPVTGALAWFRLEDFGLSLEASRRPPELEAIVTAYVLPLATTLEIEGQLDLEIRYSGIDELDVSLPPEIAPLFRFESPLIAEQTLLPDDAGWNLRFHQERKEFTRLKFRAVLPVGDDEEKAETFTATLPRPGVPAAKRLRGHWIVEANTDTELNFEATGLDKIDSLRVPVVEGYQPRHRIIAAYRYRGEEGSLTLSGTRHENADAVSTVVDSLRIDTVASTDGPDRHQARLAVRSSGEQFLELTLPGDAILWSLLVDSQTVKPVRAGKRSLRVQLPSDQEGGAAVAIEIIYQTPGKQWRGSGRETLAPLELAERIPVMQTEWFLHLPEGYDYQKFESNLGQEFRVVDRLLLGVAGEALGSGLDTVFGTSIAGASRESRKPGWTNFSPLSDDSNLPPQVESSMAKIRQVERKLQTIILPHVEFADTPLRDALDFLQSRSVELDVYESNPAEKGISIVLDSSLSASAVVDTPITLRLNNAPLAEVLRYTASLGQLKYRVEPGAVAVVALSEPDTNLYTEVYTVPPTFISSFRVAPVDPFASPVETDPVDPFGGSVKTRNEKNAAPPTAKDVLESAGITFGPGSSAVYDPQTSRLTVKNTRDQMELVEAYQESIVDAPAVEELRALQRQFPDKDFSQEIEAARRSAYTDEGINGGAAGASPRNFGAGGIAGNGSESDVPAIASQYVVRLQERVKKADEAALRGSQLMADGDYQGAVDQYRTSMELLPDSPMTEPRYRAFVKQFSRSSVLLARQRADEGRYPEAIAMIEEVLQPSVDPLNTEAKRLLEQLNDPDYYSPALAPQHLERVRKVKLALKQANGFIELGDYDRANQEYSKALNEDRYNVAARRGAENNQRHRMDYYDSAYDHTRSKMLREVAAGWESPVPTGLEAGAETSIPVDSATTNIRRVEDKLKTIIIPSVEFADTPLKDALEFLQQRSVELDTNESDPARRGISIILDAGSHGGAATPAPSDDDGFGFESGSGGGSGIADTRITLRLSNVPLAEALRYTTSLAQLKYKVEPYAIVIVPLSQSDADLFTNVYTVPPTFLSSFDDAGSGGAAAADPFADPGDTGGGIPARRRTAKDILESAGITFGTGSSAIYNPSTGQLIVRNTQDQMELVEAYQESIRSAPNVEELQELQRQFPDKDFSREIEEARRFADTEESGSGGAASTRPRVFGAGGTAGNALFESMDDTRFINPGEIEDKIPFLGGAARPRGFDFRDAGKRPLAFALPETGRSYRFAGFYSPEPISFRFVHWERQIRFAWVWILVGGLAFWFGALGKLRKPVFLGLAGVIVLTFVPLLVTRSLTEFCNALLLGWVVAMALALLMKISRKAVGDEA